MKRRTEISGSLILITLLLGGCGSSGDSGGDGCGLALAVLTLGIGCIAQDLGIPITYGSGSSGPTTTSPPPPTTPPPPSTTPPLTVRTSPLILSRALDVEPNNSISTPSATSFPAPFFPEQNVGFSVRGTINNLTDGIDTYAFTAARSRTFTFELCSFPEASCTLLLTADRSLDVEIAFLSVVDQFGTVLLSSQGDTVNRNVQRMSIDAGVLYYVMVVAEDTMNEDKDYKLNVFETTSEAGSVAQKPIPSSPSLSAGAAASLTTTLDWIPPSMHADGTPLADLSEYIVYFGQLSGIYTDFHRLDNPGLVTYVLDLPSSGSWFIAITALDSAGNESEFSNEVSVSVMCECDLPPGDPELIAG